MTLLIQRMIAVMRIRITSRRNGWFAAALGLTALASPDTAGADLDATIRQLRMGTLVIEAAPGA